VKKEGFLGFLENGREGGKWLIGLEMRGKGKVGRRCKLGISGFLGKGGVLQVKRLE
jgi:hypothetical protein